MLYRENQVSGNCRIHALNAFFQKNHITPESFAEYARQFDAYLKKTYNTIVSSMDFDLVNSDQNNIVCYILKKESELYSTKYFALNYHLIYRGDVQKCMEMAEFFFVYNINHIWGVKKFQGKWYTLDSMAAISECDPNHLLQMNNLGFIVILPAIAVFNFEYYQLASNISIETDARKTHAKIVKYLLEKQQNKEVIGNIEISINVCIEFVERFYKKINLSAHKKNILSKMIKKYYTFLPIFTDGEYNNISLKVSFLPYIIYGILYLGPEIAKNFN